MNVRNDTLGDGRLVVSMQAIHDERWTDVTNVVAMSHSNLLETAWSVCSYQCTLTDTMSMSYLTTVKSKHRALDLLIKTSPRAQGGKQRAARPETSSSSPCDHAKTQKTSQPHNRFSTMGCTPAKRLSFFTTTDSRNDSAARSIKLSSMFGRCN
jgi:hypothetical protein